MAQEISRRDVLKGGIALAAMAAAPALAQGEEVVPWTDIPENYNPAPATGPHALDTRTIQKSSFITPNESFFAVQHYGPLAVDVSAFRLRVSGLVNKPLDLTLDELKRRPRQEQIVGFECSGNNPARLNMMIGNAKWAGTSLSALLKDAGLKATAREVVFFAADKGMEEITHGGQPQKVEQNFARSLAIADATRPEVFLAWEMNGVPLPAAHGAPVRLIVPGWYGVANVKWVNHIYVQDTRFMNRFMARDYVTMTETKVGDQTIWKETSVGRIRLKSMVARLTRTGNKFTAVGFALNDGTPLKSVEVRVDNGPWQPATLERNSTPYSWKLFSLEWNGLTAGDHTIVSRVTDSSGITQPEESEMQAKKTRWENNGQFTRKFRIS